MIIPRNLIGEFIPYVKGDLLQETVENAEACAFIALDYLIREAEDVTKANEYMEIAKKIANNEL